MYTRILGLLFVEGSTRILTGRAADSRVSDPVPKYSAPIAPFGATNPPGRIQKPDVPSLPSLVSGPRTASALGTPPKILFVHSPSP
ncbi:unannotated protein [freshwater metagenome]|uniref:Unannotated protein n=1 Tax=freshwater metagenome TaxID=449393 RepID=A0A6J6QY71_9ZZZZ